MSRDKRITVRQAVELVQDAYDRFEQLALQTLREELGFDQEQIEKFVEAFSERAAEECLRIETKLRR